MTHAILNTIGPNVDAEARAILEKIGTVDHQVPTQSELVANAGKYTILLVGLGLNVDRAVIDAGKNLKIIATATTGTDHIDIPYAESKGIRVISLRGEEEFLKSITATAELALGLLLALARGVVPAANSVNSGQWDRESFRGTMLSGKTAGIIGVGRLGSLMAGYCKALRMRILGFDPHKDVMKAGCEAVSLDQLLTESDVVSLHVPLTPETEGMISDKALAMMKPTAFLINTSRGKVVDEAALLNALRKSALGGYGTDVLADELSFHGTISKNPLAEFAKAHTNVVITPHIGGMTHESRRLTDVFIAKKLQEAARS